MLLEKDEKKLIFYANLIVAATRCWIAFEQKNKEDNLNLPMD